MKSIFAWLLLCSIVADSIGLDKLESFSKIATLGTKNSEFVLPTLSTGTTIVGLCCRDGVVLGADTRSTSGSVVMDKNKLKIHYISERIRCCAAGTAADCDQIARQAGKFVALEDIENQLAGEVVYGGSVTAAMESILTSLSQPTPAGRTPSAVFILGGVDHEGPRLYQLEADGFPQRVAFGSLGSGSADALAILETAVDQASSSRFNSSNPHIVDVDMETAIKIVRQAVRAGIVNDLGSGSHVDIVAISSSAHSSTRQWRETMVSDWDKDRVHPLPQSRIMQIDNRSLLSREEVLGRRVWSRTMRQKARFNVANGDIELIKEGNSSSKEKEEEEEEGGGGEDSVIRAKGIEVQVL